MEKEDIKIALREILAESSTKLEKPLTTNLSNVPVLGAIIKMSGSRKAIAAASYAILALVNKKFNLNIDEETMTQIMIVAISLIVGVAVEDHGKGKIVAEKALEKTV